MKFKYVMIPCCVNQHWRLLVVFIEEKSVGVADSHKPNGDITSPLLGYWQTVIQKKGEQITRRRLAIACGEQLDGSSCGVFVLMTAELILLEKTIR